MLLRRFIDHVRGENWFAVALDFVVVVVGIFIGFQLDRLYEAQRTRSGEESLMAALAEDFELNRKDLQDAIDINALEVEAALTLREEARKAQPELSVAELNQLVVTISRLPTFDVARSAYDNLTNTGDLARLNNEALQRALAEFYARVELVELVQSAQELLYATVFQPYVMENLDKAATTFMWSGDPEAAGRLEPLQYSDAILDVLKTRTFQNVVAGEWEIASDLKQLHEELLEQVIRIEEMLGAGQ